jgi:hypothetical protein
LRILSPVSPGEGVVKERAALLVGLTRRRCMARCALLDVEDKGPGLCHKRHWVRGEDGRFASETLTFAPQVEDIGVDARGEQFGNYGFHEEGIVKLIGFAKVLHSNATLQCLGWQRENQVVRRRAKVEADFLLENEDK